MKFQLSIRPAILFLLFILFGSCNIATQLPTTRVNDNLMVRYALFYNNRTANHKPTRFYVSVDTLNTKSRNHSLYIFNLNSDTVEKYHDYIGQRANYKLMNDLTNNNCDEKLFPLTELESEIFYKIIYFSDSLKLKNFHFLEKSKGFKISPQKFGYYSRAK